MKQTIFNYADEKLKQNPILVCTIIRQSGSSPRGVGALMMLTPDGEIQGSIGGGRLEAMLVEGREKFLKQRVSQVLSFHLSEAEAADLDMICGGNISVLMEPIFPEDAQFVSLFSAVRETIQRQGCGWMISAFAGDGLRNTPVKKAFITLQGKVIGNIPVSAAVKDQQLLSLDLPDEALPIKDLTNVNLQAQLIQSGTKQFLIQPVGQFSKVFIIGAGHIAQKVAQLTQSVGFQTVVLDDREEFLSEERFPLVDQRITLPDFRNVFATIHIDLNSYLVIVTRGHSSDKMVLQQALQTPAGYIGMIGSQRKIKATFDLLRKEGVTEADLNRVHSPIGLAIGAETPEEIAISIIAELIQERARKELKI